MTKLTVTTEETVLIRLALKTDLQKCLFLAKNSEGEDNYWAEEAKQIRKLLRKLGVTDIN